MRPLAVGLDLGSQKTIIVDETGEIIRTDTGTKQIIEWTEVMWLMPISIQALFLDQH